MTKIEKLLIDFEPNWQTDKYELEIEDIKNICTEYAEFYAKKCLEIAINEINCGNAEDFQYDIARKSILNIKLPEHE